MTDKIKTVLVVEDEDDVRSGICGILNGLYSVKEARTGKEALEAAESLFPFVTLGIVLLDIKLPDMSGLEVLKKLLEENRLLTVIMVTAMKDSSYAVQALSEGASDYLTKPFTSEELLSKLKFAEEKGYLFQQFDHIYHKLDRWRADVDSRLLEARRSRDYSDIIRDGKAGTYEEIEKQIKEKLNKEIKIEAATPRVLVVDDEDDMRSAITEIVKEKYEVESTPNAKGALDLIRSKSFDLALLDIRLPDMSGLDLLKEVKKLKPKTYIIMVTALKDISLTVDAIKSGACDYVTKPFTSADLLKTIGTHLELKGKKERLAAYLKEIDEELYSKPEDKL